MIQHAFEKFLIREATNIDAKAISELIFNIWWNEYKFDVKQEDFPDLQNIEKYYFNQGGHFMVAILDNKLVGTIACSKLTEDAFVLKRMFTKKEYRGLDIAKQLLETLWQKVFLSENAEQLSFYLSTKAGEAIAAEKFYIKNGFNVISKADLPDNFPFFHQDDLFMLASKVRNNECN